MIGAVPTTPPTPVEGGWGGRTSDALAVSFTVREGEIEDARFTFTWGFCGDFESALPNLEPIRADGSWAYHDTRGPKIEATFLAPDRVVGTVTAPSRELPGCPKSEATFVARPGPVPPPPQVLIPTGEGLAAHPRRIVVPGTGSRPGPWSFYGLRWARIGLGEARASGRALIGARGEVVRAPATIYLERPVDRDGYRAFRLLRYRLEGPLPNRVARTGQISMKRMDARDLGS